MDTIFCPECGHSKYIDRNYNYDTAQVEYECLFCGETFTDNEIVHCDICGEQILFGEVYHNDEGDTICGHCFQKHFNK